MCELCESSEMDKDGRKIIKTDWNTFEIQKWVTKGFEIDSEYILDGSMEITYCPDCKKILI